MIMKEVSKVWSLEKVNKLKAIGDRAGAFVWLCDNSSKHYQSRSNYFDFVLIIAAFMLSIGNVPSLVWDNNVETIKLTTAIVAGLTCVLALVKSLYKWLDYQTQISNFLVLHSKYSDQYIAIQHSINVKTSETPRLKHSNSIPSFTIFYEDMKALEIKLNNQTPHIPESVLNKYYKLNGTNALSKKILFGETNVITV